MTTRWPGYAVLAVVAMCAIRCAPSGDRSIEVGGVERTYGIYLPSAYAVDHQWPLILALHPFTGSGRSMERLTGLNAVAETDGFIVVYPDGLLRRWNYGFTESSPDDVAFILALIDTLVAEYGVDPQRVYLTGASNGASMTYRLLCEAGDRFAAAAVVMGGTIPREIAESCPSEVSVPLMIIHGTDDTILPWSGGVVFAGPGRTIDLLSIDESAAYWRTRNGCDGTAAEAPLDDVDPHDGTSTTIATYAECISTAPVVVYRVEGGGHTWPGGPDNYPGFIVGRTSRDFRASEIIGGFFAQHVREPAE